MGLQNFPVHKAVLRSSMRYRMIPRMREQVSLMGWDQTRPYKPTAWLRTIISGMSSNAW